MVKKIVLYFILICSGNICLGQTAPLEEGLLKPNDYVLSVSGDTINRTDKMGLRYGIWNVYHEKTPGDPAFFEVGIFEKNKKQGNWKTYTESGFITREEMYYNDYKNGEIKIYEDGFLVCRGKYRALRTDVAYDTIEVENPLTSEFVQRIVPTSLGSVRDGFWTFYTPPYNKIARVEQYLLDDLIYSKDYTAEVDSAVIKQRTEQFPHKSNETPSEFWGDNNTKSAPRFTDFPANMKYVKPNPGKKNRQ